MSPADIISKIRMSIDDANVTLEDLTGTQDHWRAVIVSRHFEGKSLMVRHRMVMTALAEELRGPIHALTMDLKAPSD